MRRSRLPASSYCSASERDNSDWDGWAFKASLRLRAGTPCLGLEVSTAQKGEARLLVRAHSSASSSLSRRPTSIPIRSRKLIRLLRSLPPGSTLTFQIQNIHDDLIASFSPF